uniref:Uncharacterized protein n=1 Tax=Spironucleus salmonicida TaxID=348837 RepID=V6LD29_9EUKA|eukprot:EST42400.1 Hypothetical protein SS50377_18045 [Spironucleus salmonicida]
MHSVQQLENQLPEMFTMLTQDKESFLLEYQSKHISLLLNSSSAIYTTVQVPAFYVLRLDAKYTHRLLAKLFVNREISNNYRGISCIAVNIVVRQPYPTTPITPNTRTTRPEIAHDLLDSPKYPSKSSSTYPLLFYRPLHISPHLHKDIQQTSLAAVLTVAAGSAFSAASHSHAGEIPSRQVVGPPSQKELQFAVPSPCMVVLQPLSSRELQNATEAQTQHFDSHRRSTSLERHSMPLRHLLSTLDTSNNRIYYFGLPFIPPECILCKVVRMRCTGFCLERPRRALSPGSESVFLAVYCLPVVGIPSQVQLRVVGARDAALRAYAGDWQI